MINIPGFERANLETFIDGTNIMPGEYDALITVFYNDEEGNRIKRTRPEKFTFKTPIEPEKQSKIIWLITGLGTLVVILILLNIYFLFFRKK